MTIVSLPTGERLQSLPERAVIALGFFDGVHLGHRIIIDTARREAERIDGAPCVWMISSSGGAYKNGSLALTDEEEKYSLLYKAGARFAVVHSFDEIRSLDGAVFVRNILKKALGAVAVVCGFNFRFGKGASMGVDDLRSLCAREGLSMISVTRVTDGEGVTVSSTEIRRLISEGSMEEAALMLGRPYSFTSPVLEGKKLGRTIGFPTVNQLPEKGRLIPADGVYAVCVEFCDSGIRYTYPGAANVGECPTVSEDRLIEAGIANDGIRAEGAAGAGRRVCETYIAGFDGELYGKDVTVHFLSRLRGEVAFSSLDELREQIRRDADTAVKIYNEIYGKR